MTVKEAIGRFKAPQLVCQYHRMCMLRAPHHRIKECRTMAQDFAENNFQIQSTEVSHNWLVKPNLSYEDTTTANKIVVAVEGAMGIDYYKQPMAILKLTTEDGMIYYYDGEDKLTIRKQELKDITLQKNFVPIELQLG